jgi:hypothetical protein
MPKAHRRSEPNPRDRWVDGNFRDARRAVDLGESDPDVLGWIAEDFTDLKRANEVRGVPSEIGHDVIRGGKRVHSSGTTLTRCARPKRWRLARTVAATLRSPTPTCTDNGADSCRLAKTAVPTTAESTMTGMPSRRQHVVRYVIDNAGCSKHKILHTGQSQFTDLVGGKPLGLAIAWINRRHIELDGSVPPHDFIFPDIQSLNQCRLLTTQRAKERYHPARAASTCRRAA